MNHIATIKGTQIKSRVEKEMSDRLQPVGTEQEKLCNLVVQDVSSVTLLYGEHGSGKTTQMPALVSQALKEDPLHNSLVVVPSALNARTVAAWMNSSDKTAQFANGILAGKVASIIPGHEETPASTITYITDEVLERWLRAPEGNIDDLKDYRVVFIDDYHCRSMFTEAILLRIKRIIQIRDKAGSPIHFIIMSASPNLDDLMDYFSIIRDNVIFLPPVTSDPTKPRLVEKYVAGPAPPRLLDDVYQQIDEIVAAKSTSALEDVGILVFLPGEQDVQNAFSHCLEKYPNITCRRLHGNVHLDDQMDAVKCEAPKIVIAVDSAVVGLTIKRIESVIVTGLTDILAVDPIVGHPLRSRVALSDAELQQQACRVGRTFPGTCYYMFEQTFRRSLERNKSPDVLRDDCVEYLLRLFSIFPEKFPAKGSMELMIYPQFSIIQVALRKLRVLGFVVRSGSGYSLTERGKRSLCLPGKNSNARLLFGMIDETVDTYCTGLLKVDLVAVLLYEGGPLVRPHHSVTPEDMDRTTMERKNRDRTIIDPTIVDRKYRVSSIGDIWLQVQWLEKCLDEPAASNGTGPPEIDNLIKAHPDYSIDKTAYKALYELRLDVAHFAGLLDRQAVPTPELDNNAPALRDLAEVMQWQLIEADGGNATHIASGQRFGLSTSSVLGRHMHSYTVVYLDLVKDGATYTASKFLRVPSKIVDEIVKSAGFNDLEYNQWLRDTLEPLT